jgi:hypothetical protein
MGRIVRVLAALVLAVGVGFAGHASAEPEGPAPAQGDDAPFETDEPGELAPDTTLIRQSDSLLDPTVLLFAGVDGWRHGVFAHSGLLWSPQGLDRPGFTLKLLSGRGLYTFWSGALKTDVVAAQSTAFILPGWRFIHGKLQVTAFAGLDVQEHRLSPDDLSSRLRGQLWGARVGFDLWFQPSPVTMVSADASASTVGRSYSARLAYGWRLLDLVYAGPEIGALGSDNYRQVRAGFHTTGLRTGPVEWAASAGWAGDSDRRGSLYGRISVMARR